MPRIETVLFLVFQKQRMLELTQKISPRLFKISEIISKEGVGKYRMQQIMHAIYRKRVSKYSEITTIPVALRSKIINELGDDILSLTPTVTQKSQQCEKLLFKLHDNSAIESVWMQFRDSGHRSVCISSQAGCSLACSFCSTGKAGFKRQLTTDEIVDQVMYFQRSRDGGESASGVDTVSFMGMGEAFGNPRCFDALKVLTDKDCFGFSPSRLNVSTVGMIPGIAKLKNEFPKVNLAFSLHSPFNDERTKLIPLNRVYPLAEVMKELVSYCEVARQKILLAYLVLPGLNDTKDHAKAIRNLLDDIPSHLRGYFRLNLIRYNPAEGVDIDYQRTTREKLEVFKSFLNAEDIPFTLRQSFGVDIDAACGQLYNNSIKNIDQIKKKGLTG
jgi:23S rRNA (adenine-C8)-methyltransferase